MLEDYITIASASFTIILYLITFFLILEIKRKVTGKIILVLNNLFIALILVITGRIFTLLVTMQILSPFFNYIQEVIALLFGIFLLWAILKFYKFVFPNSNKRRYSFHKRKNRSRKSHKRR
ncbi:Uncharacterised protein [uncultured archaeon]|nr:Uncharacterised protein [uncultured archaeon]